jgi:hypothetical protein
MFVTHCQWQLIRQVLSAPCWRGRLTSLPSSPWLLHAWRPSPCHLSSAVLPVVRSVYALPADRRAPQWPSLLCCLLSLGRDPQLRRQAGSLTSVVSDTQGSQIVAATCEQQYRRLPDARMQAGASPFGALATALLFGLGTNSFLGACTAMKRCVSAHSAMTPHTRS